MRLKLSWKQKNEYMGDKLTPSLNPSSRRRRLYEPEAARGEKIDPSPLTGEAGLG